MDGPVRLKQLQILSHEYKVSSGGSSIASSSLKDSQTLLCTLPQKHERQLSAISPALGSKEATHVQTHSCDSASAV